MSDPSPYPQRPPYQPPRPPAPRPVAGPPRPPAKARLPRWGWLEWFLIVQSVILPAMLFVPGVRRIRIVIRVVSFCFPLLAWAAILKSGRAGIRARPYPGAAWLKGATAVLLLEIFHPLTNSLISGPVQALFYISVFCPAFWAGRVVETSRQIPRLMGVLLACNAISALMGMGQVARPATFNPPFIPGYTDLAEDSPFRAVLSYKDASGQTIIRPCGLSDTAGAASGAGFGAALFGLAFALRPIGALKRLACLGFAFVGVAVIYYSQVRTSLVMLVISLAVLVVIFCLQRDFVRAGALSGLGAALIVGAFSWVVARSGLVVVERFYKMTESNAVTMYTEKSGRSGFVAEALQVWLPANPLGLGLGRWGTVYSTFGNLSMKPLWVEVMIPAWVADGGAPLLFCYVGGLAAAVGSSLYVALRSKDRDLAFWAAVVVAWDLSILATCLSFVTFVTITGSQFWMLSAALHTALAASVMSARRSPSRAPPRRGPVPAPRPPGFAGPFVPPPARPA